MTVFRSGFGKETGKPEKANSMKHEKVLYVLAWVFTAAAAALGIYGACAGKTMVPCVLLMTLALAFQCAYGKEIKRGTKRK
jgi:hypothetical protein